MSLPRGTAELIANAYAEDLGELGDITTAAVIDPRLESSADLVARQAGCIAGLSVVEACFLHVDTAITMDRHRTDGDVVEGGSVLATVSGSTASILTAERVALNLLGRLSGIATATRTYVDAVSGTGARISDTRKTTPGMRALEKYAVASGGGRNHRFGLYDAVLIKDNHIAAAGSIADAVRAARASVGPSVTVQVEVDTLDQLAAVLATDADAVLLDNMGIDDLAAGVALVGGRMLTEASGGVTLESVRSIAETGVDVISVGWLTHSAPALDVGLDLRPTGNRLAQFE
ncbi:MAG TPA: carboxylating nicotinate-nucleotide diphosphorylase [Acidimicrobiia bacterium]|nr:carboxylating nicotinate-nucleotide diphosphorylase [Acidimicrobiia bacterium]